MPNELQMISYPDHRKGGDERAGVMVHAHYPMADKMKMHIPNKLLILSLLAMVFLAGNCLAWVPKTTATKKKAQGKVVVRNTAKKAPTSASRKPPKSSGKKPRVAKQAVVPDVGKLPLRSKQIHMVRVPDVRLMVEPVALVRLKAAGLTGKLRKETWNSMPYGLIISSSPIAGTEVSEGTMVDFIVSKGPPAPFGLHFDGVYMAGAEGGYYYLRFFPDGTVIHWYSVDGTIILPSKGEHGVSETTYRLSSNYIVNGQLMRLTFPRQYENREFYDIVVKNNSIDAKCSMPHIREQHQYLAGKFLFISESDLAAKKQFAVDSIGKLETKRFDGAKFWRKW
jgi:hypothetical protein